MPWIGRQSLETLRKRQLEFSGHAMRWNGLEKLVVTGKIEGTRATGRQRMKYLHSLGTCWPNNITPLELIKATEYRELWKHMTPNVVFEDIGYSLAPPLTLLTLAPNPHAHTIGWGHPHYVHSLSAD